MLKYLLLLPLLVMACRYNTLKTPGSAALQSIKIIVFEKASPAMGKLQEQLSQLTQVPVTVQTGSPLPDFAWYRPRNRYLADSLLVFLQQFRKEPGTYVVGVTTKDISIGPGMSNWGIMGLGYCPGQVCVLSEYRIKQKAKGLQQQQERMLQLALHEMGHNFSLPHCPDTNCLMVAAKGKMTLDGNKYYCSKCSAVLIKKGILLRSRQRV